ncbi:MAG: DUF4350 domain-containing protein [Thermoguttaceae bacterium]
MSLPSLSRPDRLILSILLLAAGLVGIGTWLLEPPEKTGGVLRQPSTFFNAGYGTKAAYQVLERLRFDVARLRRPIVPETLDGIGTLVMLEPRLGLDVHELAALKDWIQDGHALVVVPVSSSPHARAGGSRRPASVSGLEEWLAWQESEQDAEKRSSGSADKHRPNSAPMLDVADPILAGIKRLVSQGDRRFRVKSPLRGSLANADTHAFWKDNGGVIGLRIEAGKGTIIALADSFPFSNLGINEADNGLLLANVASKLSDRYRGRIAFDEYHLGFPEQEWSSLAMIRLILAGPWRWAIGQAFLVGLLGLYGAAVRFGSPQDVTREPRRQHREFAESAGRLLDESGATGVAAETLYHHYRDRLCRSASLDPEIDDRQLQEVVRDRWGHEFATALQEAKDAATTTVGRQRLLIIFRKIHHFVERLEHGT